MEDKRKSILIICGPTASGKTKLAVSAAKSLCGEIVSADSMQIYKTLNIGTAKPTEEEKCGIKHFIIDVLNPDIKFSVADYVAQASACIDKIAAENKTPIVCGGTGQYISGLINGLRFIGEKSSAELREKLWQREQNEGIDKLYAELCEIDEEYAKTLHKNNKGRVLRALELYYQTGKTMTQQLKQSVPKTRPYNELIIGLNFTERAALYDRINTRVDLMISSGLLDEARMVYENKDKYLTASQAIGYKELFNYFEGNNSLNDCIDKLKQASRNYAKRQLTWFKKINGIIWLDAESESLTQQVLQLWEKHNERTQ